MSAKEKLPGSDSVTYEKENAWIVLHLDAPNVEFSITDKLSYALVHSRELAESYMKQDFRKTSSLQKAWKLCEGSFRDVMEGWVQGNLECQKEIPQGPKDWSPNFGRLFKGEGTVKESANTTNFDQTWQGEVFEYTRFTTFGGLEGMTVFWHKGGDPRGSYHAPEVWIGDIDGFFSTQWMDLSDPEEYGALNADFDNGILWAVEKLKLLENNAVDPDLLRMIMNFPKLLSARLQKKILADPDAYPSGLAAAIEEYT